MESELERILRNRTAELEAAKAALQESEQTLAQEIHAAHRLQHLATQVVSVQGMEALYGQILDTALAILHADLDTIQMVHPERGPTGELKLLGHRGFSVEAVKRWEWVGAESRTTCGEALRTRQKVVVPDLRTCDFMAGSEDLGIFLGAGIRAAQSLPLVSRSGAFLGMLTTYWHEPHDMSASELRALDVLARLAADLIERARAEAALRENETQLQSLAGSLLTSQEEERRRVSRELHDELIQRLAWLAMELGSVAGELSTPYEPLRTRIQTLQRAVVEATESTRHMAYRLHPGELEDFGLATALRVYCRDFSRDGLAIEFTSRNLPEAIDREVASCLYRVVQESLRNVAKHANARKAWVTLDGRENSILLHVRDAGVGFPVESLAGGGGLGVISMKERVRNSNGSFEIQSTPGQGTVITVEVPLTNAKTSAAGRLNS